MKQNPFKQGDKVIVSGIACTVKGIATDGRPKEWLAKNTYLAPNGSFISGWIPNVFIKRDKGQQTITEKLKAAELLEQDVESRLRPIVDAIGDHLIKGGKRSILGMKWIDPEYSIAVYRGTGAGVSLSHGDQIYAIEDDISFTVRADYYTGEHPGNDYFHDPLHKSFRISCPISLVEKFTQKAFDAWVKKEAKSIANEELAEAKQALEKAKDRVKSRS
jgi:hypothetical protein